MHLTCWVFQIIFFSYTTGPSCSKHHWLASSLMTKSLTVVAKVHCIFKYIDILLQKCVKLLQCKSYYDFFQAKISMYLSYFKIEVLMSR